MRGCRNFQSYWCCKTLDFPSLLKSAMVVEGDFRETMLKERKWDVENFQSKLHSSGGNETIRAERKGRKVKCSFGWGWWVGERERVSGSCACIFAIVHVNLNFMLRAQSEIIFFFGTKGSSKEFIEPYTVHIIYNDIKSCTHQISSMGNATLELLNCTLKQ